MMGGRCRPRGQRWCQLHVGFSLCNSTCLSLEAPFPLVGLLELLGEGADARVQRHHTRAEVHILLAGILWHAIWGSGSRV